MRCETCLKAVAFAGILLSGCDSGDDDDVLADSGESSGTDSTEGSGDAADSSSTGDGDSDGASESGGTCTGTSQPPYDPYYLPDTTGWEEISASGIYAQGGGWEGFDEYLHPCGAPEETWCVYWAVRPFPGATCRGTVRLKGRVSGTLDTLELCNASVGGSHAHRAFVVEEVEAVGECDDTMCQPGQEHCEADAPTCELAGDCE